MTSLDRPVCADGCGNPASVERPTSCGGHVELVCTEHRELKVTR